jgi:hypothetical protein
MNDQFLDELLAASPTAPPATLVGSLDQMDALAVDYAAQLDVDLSDEATLRAVLVGTTMHIALMVSKGEPVDGSPLISLHGALGVAQYLVATRLAAVR